MEELHVKRWVRRFVVGGNYTALFLGGVVALGTGAVTLLVRGVR